MEPEQVISLIPGVDDSKISPSFLVKSVSSADRNLLILMSLIVILVHKIECWQESLRKISTEGTPFLGQGLLWDNWP